MIGDYIAFIQPISQFNNTQQMYEFDLIYSEDLGFVEYSDRKLHCCFNIYKRPMSGEFNKKQQVKLKDVRIIRQDKKDYKSLPFDLRMCHWGDGTAGKILKDGEEYSGEYKIQILNPNVKDKVINVLCNYDWKSKIERVAMRSIKQWQIIEVLKEQIPELE